MRRERIPRTRTAAASPGSASDRVVGVGGAAREAFAARTKSERTPSARTCTVQASSTAQRNALHSLLDSGLAQTNGPRSRLAPYLRRYVHYLRMRRRVSTDLRPTAGRAASVSRRARPRRPRRSAQGPVPPNFYARALRCAPESTAAALRAQHVVAAQRMPLRSQLDPARHRACADERPLHGRLAPYRGTYAIDVCAAVFLLIYLQQLAALRRPRAAHVLIVPAAQRKAPCPQTSTLARSQVRRLARSTVLPAAAAVSCPERPRPPRSTPGLRRGTAAPRRPRRSRLAPHEVQARVRRDSWRAHPSGPAQSHARIWPRFMWDKRGTQRSSGSGALALRASPSLARRKSSAAARAPPSQRPPPAGSPASAARVTDLGCRRANPPPLAPRAVYLQRYIPGARLTLPATACSALPPPSRPLHPPAPGPPSSHVGLKNPVPSSLGMACQQSSSLRAPSAARREDAQSQRGRS
ncbi:hypothetical protein B0H15DRAFT_854087 [Mycena belliarum]|uniref:Uncharacterized protein n=1 Tax=Mycena belliarum TaxID=1033014 RepID=A0AAD6U1G2_9AGAR|nr:hypothetical protein B0H15DRAFT_854087 [Mycena belliae]